MEGSVNANRKAVEKKRTIVERENLTPELIPVEEKPSSP